MPNETKIDELVDDLATSVDVLATQHTKRMDEFEAEVRKALVDLEAGKGVGLGSRSSSPAAPFLTIEQKIADRPTQDGSTPADADQIRLGALVAYAVNPSEGVKASLSDLEEKAAVSRVTGADGSFLIPESVSARFIDAARNRAVVLRAGAATIPMATGDVRLPGWDVPPTAAWRSDGGAFPEPDASFRAVWLRAKSLAATVPIDLEVFADAGGALESVAALIESALQKAAAVEVDRAALDGLGTANEPLGLANTPGLTTGLTSVGSLTFDDLIGLHFAVMGANHENTGFVIAPRDEQNLAELKESSTAAYLQPPPVLANVPRYVTNNVPQDLGGGGNESIVFAGDWSQLAIGVRTGLALKTQVDPYTRMASNGQIVVNAYLRADVAVLDPTAFALATGVTA